jgi:hypothetical protein
LTASSDKDIDKEMSFATGEDMAGRGRQNQYPVQNQFASSDGYNLTSKAEIETPYVHEREYDDGSTSFWNVRRWGWKHWAVVGVIVAIVAAVVIAVAVTETKKNNAYPDYLPLTYSLADTCLSSFLSPHSSLTGLTLGRFRYRFLLQVRLLHRL